LQCLHPPEVVLNEKQALRAIWNMANMPMTSQSGGSITNNFNIDELVVREEADVNKIAGQLYDMQQTKSLGAGVR